MRFFKKSAARILCFLIIFSLLSGTCYFLFLKVDGTTFLTVYDYEKEDKIDVLFVGNSLCRCDINPYIVDRNMGTNSFNLSKESAKFEGLYQLLKEELPKKNISNVVIVIDPYQVFEPAEETVVLAALSPYIRNPIDNVYYSMQTALEYGDGFDRFFPWRMFYEESPKSLINNVIYKFNKEKCYKDKLYQFNHLGGRVYKGKGYGCHSMPIDSKSIKKAITEKDHLSLNENAIVQLKKHLLKIKQLCDKQKCTLTAITTPLIKDVVLRDGDYRKFFEITASACSDIEIEYLNFALIKEKYLSGDLNPHFYDGKSHLNGEGADIFSRALSEVLKKYYAGENVDYYFYKNEQFFGK